jgi:hypothetical protein
MSEALSSSSTTKQRPPLPETEPLSKGTYQPANYDPNPAFPAPAPAESGATALSTFDRTDPDGTWKLWVFDEDTDDEAGSDEAGPCTSLRGS